MSDVDEYYENRGSFVKDQYSSAKSAASKASKFLIKKRGCSTSLKQRCITGTVPVMQKRPQTNLRSFQGLRGGSALGVYTFNLVSKVLDDYPPFELQSRGNLMPSVMILFLSHRDLPGPETLFGLTT